MTAPIFQLFNTFHLTGRLSTHNIDGASARTKLKNYYLVVRTKTKLGDVVGCTAAKLA